MQSTDLFLGWRPSEGKAASRRVSPSQMLEATLPAAFSTLSTSTTATLGALVVSGNTTLNHPLSVTDTSSFFRFGYGATLPLVKMQSAGTDAAGAAQQVLSISQQVTHTGTGGAGAVGALYSASTIDGAPNQDYYAAAFTMTNRAKRDSSATPDQAQHGTLFTHQVKDLPTGGLLPGQVMADSWVQWWVMQDRTNLPSSQGGALVGVEFDIFGNNADDFATKKRFARQVVLNNYAADAAHPLEWGYGDYWNSFTGGTADTFFNVVSAYYAGWTVAAIDLSQGTGARANPYIDGVNRGVAIKLRDGAKLGFNGDGATGSYMTHGSSALQYWSGSTLRASIGDAGLITFTGGLTWSGTSGGSFAAGNFAWDTNWGAWLQGKSGANSDIALATSGGTAAVKIGSTGAVTMEKGAFPGGNVANTWSGTSLTPPNLAFASLRTFNGTLPVGQSSDNGAHLNWIKATDNMLVGTSGVSAISHFAVNGQMGSTATGNRVAHNVTLAIPTLTANQAAGIDPNYNAGSFYVYSTANQGGSAQTTAGANSSLFGNILIARTGSSATYFRDLVGMEIDMISETAAGTAPLRKVGIQIVGYNDGTLVDTSNGAFIDAGLLFAQSATLAVPGFRHGILFGQNNSGFNLTATGTAVMFQAKAPTGSVPTLNTTGYGVDGLQATWASAFLRSRQFSVGPDGTLQVYSGYIAPSANGITIDASGRVGTAEGGTLAMGGTSTGGTGWVQSEMVFDNQGLGFVGYASTVVAGAVTQITVLRQAIKNGAAPTNPVTLVGRAGSLGAGLAADMTWTVKGQMDIGATSATAVNIGNGSANTRVGSGSALATNATTGFLQVPTMAGTPTGVVGAAGQGTIVINTTASKLCWSVGGGTWKDAVGGAC